MEGHLSGVIAAEVHPARLSINGAEQQYCVDCGALGQDLSAVVNAFTGEVSSSKPAHLQQH